MTTRYLDTFLNHEKDFSKFLGRNLHLKRVRLVLSRLGSPQNHLRVIHIAGSKGKGSTAALTAQILCEAGYKVGLYTSPHLYDVRERFRILGSRAKTAHKRDIFGDCIPERIFSRLIEKIRPQLEAGRHHPQFGDLTYFEVLTIAAFCYFKEKKVDFAVLETGLGGRLDATNVCTSLIAVLTPISLEHTQQLGKTLSRIAAEKAGIIKKGCMVVSSGQRPEVLKVIKARCRKCGISPLIVGKKIFKVSLLGPHQNVNAGVALEIIKALRVLGFGIGKAAVHKGLTQTFWPLRFEIVGRKPDIVLDGAHNPDSCRRLAETMGQIFPGQKAVLIFGSSHDKDIASMLRYLSPLASEIILASAAHPRAVIWNAKNVKTFFPKRNIFSADTVSTACHFALKIAGQKGLILAAGSLFVAAEARKYFVKSL